MTDAAVVTHGRRSPMPVADDNFSDTQITQVLVFALDIGGARGRLALTDA
jgi:hypothetical protein